MGCRFCATGTLGLRGHLMAGEILEQLVHAHQIEPITNVVFMGMGEPLDNYDAVVAAVKMMTDRRVFGLAESRVTVSTVGVIHRIKQMTKELPHTKIAFSLHAPTQDLRLKIVPTASAFKLPQLMEAIHFHSLGGKRRVLIEYCVLAGVNDSEEVAHQTGALLKPLNCLLNLIPYNPTEVDDGYSAPSNETVMRFRDIVFNEYGIFTTVRKEMGQDIAGACGQLAINGGQGVKGDDEEKKDSAAASFDIEDIGKSKTGGATKPKATVRRRKNGAQDGAGAEAVSQEEKNNTKPAGGSVSDKTVDTTARAALSLVLVVLVYLVLQRFR